MARGDYGFNGKMHAEGFGGKRIRAMRLQLGLRIIANEDEGKNRRAMYSVVTTGSSFGITLGFVSWEERESFNRWIRSFMEAVADGSAKSGYMTIQVPSRRFFRTAVPESGIEYGRGVTDVAYEMSLQFIGASDPLDLNLSKKMRGVSYFKGPKNDGESRYFYPAGRQIKGAESLDGTIFDPERTSGGLYSQPIEEDHISPIEDMDDRLDRFGEAGF